MSENLFGDTVHEGREVIEILPPEQLVSLGFGHDDRVGLLGTESISEKRIRAYRSHVCGHLMTKPSEMGSPCSLCLRAAIQQQIHLPEWHTLTCPSCLRSCSVPGCPNQSLCLQRHAISVSAPSAGINDEINQERWLCLPHFQMYQSLKVSRNRISTYGIMLGKLFNLISSCLVDPNKYIR